MPNPFNEILAGLSGGFTGYGQQQQVNVQRQRQSALDSSLEQDRLSQTALRQAEQAQRDAATKQSLYLRSPEFQQAFQAARAGDEGAIAHVAASVAGHPDAASYINALSKPPKMQYDATRGVMVNTEKGTATPIAGLSPTPKAPIEGTPEWEQAEIKKAQIAAKYGYHPDQLKEVQDPSDPTKTIFVPIAQAAGMHGPTKATGGSSSAGSLASVADMNKRIQQLTEGFQYFGAGPGAGKVIPSWQTRDAIEEEVGQAQANNKTDVTGQVKTALADAIGYGPKQTDPDFQKYRQLMQAARFIGEESASATKGRSNEAKVRRDIQLAMPIPSDFQNPQKLNDKLVRLQNLANLARATQPATAQSPTSPTSPGAPLTPGGGRAGGGGQTGNINFGASITAGERAALKAQGFTDQQITAKYGPPIE